MDGQLRERGTIIRFPSTANLLIDSIDRTFNPNYNDEPACDFTIVKNQSINNGFFTRMAVSEVVLNYSVANIATDWSNTTLTFSAPAPTLIAIPTAYYTVAQCLTALVAGLNAANFAGGNWVVNNTDPDVVGALPTPGVAFIYQNVAAPRPNFTLAAIDPNNEINLLAAQLGLLGQDNVPIDVIKVSTPFLLPFTYLDFCSDSLTYNQELKDNTTNNVERNVLYRWYFAYGDVPTPLDALGFPILQGYQPFCVRRALPFPKQIAWDPRQPLGNLNFQVYDSSGELFNPARVPPGAPNEPPAGEFEWKITLLLSEN